MRTVAWQSLWAGQHPGAGMEHLQVDGGRADGVIVAFDEALGPMRIAYRIACDPQWRVREARVMRTAQGPLEELWLRGDGEGGWHQGDGSGREDLRGCIDVDIWPTPFTNSLPLWRTRLRVGERREFRMAWIDAAALTVRAQPQAYTRLAERRYLFENLDGSGFRAELAVDE